MWSYQIGDVELPYRLYGVTIYAMWSYQIGYVELPYRRKRHKLCHSKNQNGYGGIGCIN